MIPATAYFLNSLLRLSLIVFGKNCPKYGFMAAKTLPYCGGSNSSPPNTDTDSASG